jgi:nucleoid DNA-binding protein
MSELVTGYYDTSDLVKRLESQTGLDEDVLRDVIKLAFQNIAEAAGKGVNAVVLDDIGTFRVAACIGRRYVVDGKEVIKPDYLKFKFKGAIKLRDIVAANLREPVKHLEVK